MLKCEDFTVEEREINGTKVAITSYRLDQKWHCTISNTDPGANIARGNGTSRESAMSVAEAKAADRLPAA